MRLEGDRRIALEKVRDYLLDLDHRDGGPKARFFRQFGFERNKAPILLEALQSHARTNEIEHVQVKAHGIFTVVRCSVETPDRRNPCIRAVWVQELGTDFHRLVTAYPAV